MAVKNKYDLEKEQVNMSNNSGGLGLPNPSPAMVEPKTPAQTEQPFYPTNRSGSVVDDGIDYYEALKNEEYKTLLDREIQLDNARSRALKTSQATLAAQGLASTGYGNLARGGIEGQYLQGLQDAESAYQSSIRGINQDEFTYKQGMQSESYNDLLASLDSDAIADVDSLRGALDKAGLVKDGRFDYDRAVELYGQRNADNLMYNLSLLEDEFGRQNSAQTVEDLKNMTFILNGDGNYTNSKGENVHDNGHVEGQSGDLATWFSQEADYLMTRAQNNQLETNSVTKVTNGRNDVIYLKWNGTGFQQVDEKAYNSASKKHTLTHYNKQNYWDNDQSIKNQKDEIERQKREETVGTDEFKAKYGDEVSKGDFLKAFGYMNKDEQAALYLKIKSKGKDGYDYKGYTYFFKNGKYYRKKN